MGPWLFLISGSYFLGLISLLGQKLTIKYLLAPFKNL